MPNDIDSRTLFKLGFLSRCAEEGLTAEEIAARMDKAAGALDWAIGIGAALGAPYVIGRSAGGLAANMLTTNPAHSPEELQMAELEEAYNRAATRAQEVAKRVAYRKTQQRRVPRRPSSYLD